MSKINIFFLLVTFLLPTFLVPSGKNSGLVAEDTIILISTKQLLEWADGDGSDAVAYAAA
jgi:hypothetical protein